MLQEISFGPHYFKMALLFRNSILLSSMLCSSEVLYGITKSHIEQLEQVDRIFFRRLFQVPDCTAIEAFYLETSAVPIRFLLMGDACSIYGISSRRVNLNWLNKSSFHRSCSQWRMTGSSKSSLISMNVELIWLRMKFPEWKEFLIKSWFVKRLTCFLLNIWLGWSNATQSLNIWSIPKRCSHTLKTNLWILKAKHFYSNWETD